MYTDVKVYQILIAVLKKYGIKNCVLSAGSRNVPFVHSVEEDDFFHCYSVVDERSAGYFALGMAQETNAPVVISCTSSTASCNYWPAVAEAFYQNAPVIVLTSDRDPSRLGQWEDQMIDQAGMYDRHVKKSVNLPLDLEKEADVIFCERLINEALLELDHHGRGPVHINVPSRAYNTSFYTNRLPDVRKISRLVWTKDSRKWTARVKRLQKAKRILVVAGQSSFVSDALRSSMKLFFEKYNCAVVMEYMANLDLECAVNVSWCFESRIVGAKTFETYLPDIVISFGGNIMMGIKNLLQQQAGKFEHWLIQEDGRVIDVFMSLTTVFECEPEQFFRYFNKKAGEQCKNDRAYYDLICDRARKIVYPEFAYSNLYVIKNIVERIPENSNLHLSINNSIRITNLFQLHRGIKVYANIGTYGIDGCMSSFLGQAAVSETLNFLVIGDLSFFYDMNVLRIRHIGRNVRILLINNHGGEEFYYNGVWQNEASDLHTAARHQTTARGWVDSLDFEYLTAGDQRSFDHNLAKFMNPDSDRPIVFEVFTEMRTDSKELYSFFGIHGPTEQTAASRGKKIVKQLIGSENAAKLGKMIKR